MNDNPLAAAYADLLHDSADPALALLVEDLDALYGAPSVPANMQARFDYLLRQRSRAHDNGRAARLAAAAVPSAPPPRAASLPAARPEPVPIPLPDRSGPRARLRQLVGVAAALLVFAMVAIVLAQIFGAGGDDDAQQAAPVDATPTPPPTEVVPALAPTPTTALSPSPAPGDDIFARAAVSPFPDADVLHVVQTHQATGRDEEPRVIDTWIDQRSRDVVVRRSTASGEPRELVVRQGTTVIEATANEDGWSSVSVTTMLHVADPNLPDPLNHLNGFRDLLARGPDDLAARGVVVNANATLDGQPVVELRIPLNDGGQQLAIVTVYLDPATLYPLLVRGAFAEERFSYPTVESLARADVPEGTFDPVIPQARYTYIREAIAPEAASSFDAYPLWWLGAEFSGYELQFIERNRSITPDDMPDRDTVSVLYLPSPDDFDNQLQIISQPPLSDIEWAHRDANHNVHGYEELEVQGHRAWLHPDQSQIEIAFPDAYVTITAPNLALAAAEALQQANAPVDLSEAAIADAIAALPEHERGCGATPFAPFVQGGSIDEARGKTVIGDAELWMQYSTLDDTSPTVIRAGYSVLSFWAMPGAPSLSLRFDNLTSGSSVEPEGGPIQGQTSWRSLAWRTIVTFPDPGCWQATVTGGDSAAVLWLDVQPSMESLATPVTTVEQFTSATAPLAPGSGRSITLQVHTDYRLDEGALHDWVVTIHDRTNDAGRQQRRMVAWDPDGNPVAWFTRDGDIWQWWQRGWFETGTVSAGLVALPGELRLADSALGMLLLAFSAESGFDVIAQPQDGDLAVTRYVVPDPASLSALTGLEVTSSHYDVWFDANGVPVRSRWVFVAGGQEIVLADVTIRDHALHSASDYDDALFDLPASVGIVHFYWDWDPLPRGLTMEHDSNQLGGPPTGSETLAITGDGVSLRLEVSPSRGGHDNRALLASYAQNDLVHAVTNTRAGPVTWLARPSDGWPIRAVWDDGTYRFDLQGDLPGWTEDDLIALVEALSAAALR